MKKTFKNAKVGDKVYSLKYGPGRVSEVNFTDAYPISATFKNITTDYTLQGRLYRSDVTPDLYKRKPVITTKARLNHISMTYVPKSLSKFARAAKASGKYLGEIQWKAPTPGENFIDNPGLTGFDIGYENTTLHAVVIPEDYVTKPGIRRPSGWLSWNIKPVPGWLAAFIDPKESEETPQSKYERLFDH